MLLGELNKKLTGQITYETKRSIIKQLVRGGSCLHDSF